MGAGAVGLAVTEQLLGREQTIQKIDRLEAGAIVVHVQHRGQVVVTACDSQRDHFVLVGRGELVIGIEMGWSIAAIVNNLGEKFIFLHYCHPSNLNEVLSLESLSRAQYSSVQYSLVENKNSCSEYILKLIVTILQVEIIVYTRRLVCL